MSDKSQRSHIERLQFVAGDVSPGDEIRYDRLHDKQPVRELRDDPKDPRPYLYCGHAWLEWPGTPCTVIELTECGDYSRTCLVGESNYRTLKSEFPWLVAIYGSHGYKALAYLGKRENQNPRLIEAIDSLTDYCVYSDDDHGALELDKAAEAWSEAYGGRSDFRKALTAYFDSLYEPDEHDLDLASDERIDALWYAMTDRINCGEDHLNEQGDSIYFPISQVMKKVRACWPGMSKPGYDGSPSLDAMLLSLAEDCTTKPETTETE